MSAEVAQSRGAGWSDSWVGADPDFRRFFGLIVLATFGPFLAMPLLSRFEPNAASALSIAGLLGFLGGPAHVSATAWLYADRAPRTYFREHPVRYFAAPVAVIVGATAIFTIWPQQLPAHLTAAYFSLWLLWHYQKQNWGIVSFCSRVSSREAASTTELWALRVAAIGGWMAAVRSVGFGTGTPVGDHADLLFQAAVGLYCVVPVLLIVALVRQPGLRSSPPRLLFVLVSCLFFLPAFLFEDRPSAFLTYALAHGFQYHVFMTFLATSPGTGTRGDDPERRRVGVRALLLCVLTLGVLLWYGGDVVTASSNMMWPLFGFVMGVTMAHFIVDAGIWRLRDRFVRGYVSEAFPFIRR